MNTKMLPDLKCMRNIQVIRRHPVTGEEALYVNKQFTRRIVGLKKEESGLLWRVIFMSRI